MTARLITPLILSATLSGCTATLATVQIVRADKAIQQAHDAGAEALAPYELTLATEYRAKAVEQFADARHGDAIDLSKLAATTARLAADKSRGPSRERDVKPEVSELTDAPSERAPSADPPPAPDTDGDFLGDDEPAPWSTEEGTP